MKKLLTLGLVFAALTVLSACTSDSNTNDQTTNIDTEEIGTQLATSVYISSGLLEGSTATASTQVIFLSTQTSPQFTNLSTTGGSEIETRMDQIMMYFNQVDVLIASSPETALNIAQSESTMEGYESQVSYTLDNKTFTIYYNVIDADEDAELEENEFKLNGVLEYDNVSLDIMGGTEVEEGEVELYFETEESTSGDYVRVEIEQDAYEQYFEIETSTNGVETYSELRLEVDGVDGAIEIYLEENGLDTYYEITKEIDGEFTIYYFEYSIGDTYGSMQLTEYVIDGEDIQHFIIEEDDYNNEYTVPENATAPDA